jgi:predicted nucleic-acid-binding Zn-ribbon protein
MTAQKNKTVKCFKCGYTEKAEESSNGAETAAEAEE